MVKYVVILFEVHQPYRLKTDLVRGLIRGFSGRGLKDLIFDEGLNSTVIKKVSSRCYIPTTKLLIETLKSVRGSVKINFSFSGVVLEQLMKYVPEVIELFKDLINSELAEVVVEPYYHSLTSVYEDPREFINQVNLQVGLIKELFGVVPKAFVNTEMIYNNTIASIVGDLGFKAVFTEGVERVLKGRSPNHIYSPPTTTPYLLLRNYRLSDDVAFRFTNRSWDQYPLFADKYLDWIMRSPGDLVVLAMDYETFGEHHSVESGILDFLKYLMMFMVKNGVEALTASEAVKLFKPVDVYDVPPENTISWADVEKDLSAWLGCEEQLTVFNRHKSLWGVINELDNDLIEVWRCLSTSDHYYYISSKGESSGEVHRYFLPYGSRTNAYCILNTALTILELRLLGLLNSW
ncbi:MAG: glycoside hydrolase family 57 protein [Desulfurococcaceae archaeon]|nr:glycoside hydrolase family 57 protein [Desulfurococcaceae archaeon]